jgi:hypothetical protein
MIHLPNFFPGNILGMTFGAGGYFNMIGVIAINIAQKISAGIHNPCMIFNSGSKEFLFISAIFTDPRMF